jgi:PAS domain S-box-containing protein
MSAFTSSKSLDALPFAVLELSGDGQMGRPNLRWRQLFGSTEFSAMTLEAMFDAPSLVRWNRQWERGQTQRQRFQVGVSIRVGEELVRYVFSAEPDESEFGNGHESKWLVFATEVEEAWEEAVAGYEQDRVALRMGAQQWQSFFNESATGKAVVGLDGKMVAINPQLCHLFGYDEAEMLQLLPRDLRHPEDRDRIEAVYQSLLEGSAPILGVAGRYMKRGGDSIQLLVSFSLVRDSKGHPLYFAAEMQDDTARFEAESALKIKVREITKLNQELERSNSDLERFAFVASHDLQEPLRKIRVFGGRLEKELGKIGVSSEGMDYLSRVLSSAERMQQLIADLLEFSRPRGPMALKPVDLNQLVREAASDFDTSMEASGGKIEIEELPTIQGDASRLRQLLCNLIGNGLKFHGEEPPRVHISARQVDSAVHLRECFDDSGQNDSGQNRSQGEANSQRYWEIRVRDNGIGFDEKELPRLLEVFGRLHPRNRFSGTGIGLAICRKVAQEHGGDITAQSRPGEGATFIVSLPVKSEDSVA